MMQSNIYARVAPLLKEIPFNCESKQLESFLNLYHSGNIIYPGAMQGTTSPHKRSVSYFGGGDFGGSVEANTRNLLS